MPNRCPVVPAGWIEETCAEAFVDREVRHGCGLRIGHTGGHKCHCGREPATEALHEISVDMTTGERSTMMDEPDVPGHILSGAARAALLSAAPSPSGLPGHWFTCSVGVARELRRWAEAGATRWERSDPQKTGYFRAAARQVRFALWKVGAGPGNLDG
jgi:hypothetical protein